MFEGSLLLQTLHMIRPPPGSMDGLMGTPQPASIVCKIVMASAITSSLIPCSASLSMPLIVAATRHAGQPRLGDALTRRMEGVGGSSIQTNQ